MRLQTTFISQTSRVNANTDLSISTIRPLTYSQSTVDYVTSLYGLLKTNNLQNDLIILYNIGKYIDGLIYS